MKKLLRSEKQNLKYVIEGIKAEVIHLMKNL